MIWIRMRQWPIDGIFVSNDAEAQPLLSECGEQSEWVTAQLGLMGDFFFFLLFFFSWCWERWRYSWSSKNNHYSITLFQVISLRDCLSCFVSLLKFLLLKYLIAIHKSWGGCSSGGRPGCPLIRRLVGQFLAPSVLGQDTKPQIAPEGCSMCAWMHLPSVYECVC